MKGLYIANEWERYLAKKETAGLSPYTSILNSVVQSQYNNF